MMTEEYESFLRNLLWELRTIRCAGCCNLIRSGNLAICSECANLRVAFSMAERRINADSYENIRKRAIALKAKWWIQGEGWSHQMDIADLVEAFK